MKHNFILILILLAISLSQAQAISPDKTETPKSIGEIESAKPEARSGLRFSGIPAIGFGDDGAGGGVVGSFYVDEPGFDPYKMSAGVKIYLTNKLVNSHALSFDRLRAFNLPWRLSGRLGFYSTPAANYCGLASDANCDESIARAESKKLGILGSDQDEFIKRYYQNRFMLFFGELSSRWLLWQDQAKLELMTNYRGSYYLNNDFSAKGPYSNSLFAKDFGSQIINGYLSTLELGLMLDKRNNEAAPTSGYWLESSIRGGAGFMGSAWDHLGGNLSVRFYVPLDTNHRLVIASQSIIDSIWGDLPFDAISRVGGSMAMKDASAIGGQYIGRGIRQQYFVGRFKAIEQLELRYIFWSFDLWHQQFDLTAAGLLDIGMTAWDMKRFTKDMQDIYTGFGGGLRINWNKTFVIRADLAVSPREDFAKSFYLVVGNVF